MSDHTIGRWHEIHDSGQPHDSSVCPWCGDEEIMEAAEESTDVPMERWIVYPQMDSVDYLDRPEPLGTSEDGRYVLNALGEPIGEINDDDSIDWFEDDDNEEA